MGCICVALQLLLSLTSLSHRLHFLHHATVASYQGTVLGRNSLLEILLLSSLTHHPKDASQNFTACYKIYRFSFSSAAEDLTRQCVPATAQRHIKDRKFVENLAEKTSQILLYKKHRLHSSGPITRLLYRHPLAATCRGEKRNRYNCCCQCYKRISLRISSFFFSFIFSPSLSLSRRFCSPRSYLSHLAATVLHVHFSSQCRICPSSGPWRGPPILSKVFISPPQQF